MQGKSALWAWAAMATMIGLLCTGCSEEITDAEVSETEEATAVTEATETTEATEATTEEELAVLGTEAVGDTVYVIELTNATERNITEFTISTDDGETYSDNYLEDDDTYAADETRILYYDTAADTEEESVDDASSTDEEELPEITVHLVFDDETTADVHVFPYTDMEAATLLLDEDGVAYLKYTSLETEEDVETLEDELAYLEAEEETTEAETEAETEAAAEETQASTKAATQAATQAATEAATEAETEAATEAATEAEDSDPDDGCIGDGGLFY